MKEEIEDYAEEIEETRSTATRELIQTGLDSKDAEPSTTSPRFITYLLGWILIAGAFVTFDQFLGYLGIVLVLANILDQRFQIIT
jgi:hypothetical protein